MNSLIRPVIEYGSGLQIRITDSYYRFVLLIRITDSYSDSYYRFVFRFVLQIRITDSYYRFVLQIRITDSYYRFVLEIRIRDSYYRYGKLIKYSFKKLTRPMNKSSSFSFYVQIKNL